MGSPEPKPNILERLEHDLRLLNRRGDSFPYVSTATDLIQHDNRELYPYTLEILRLINRHNL